MAKYEYKIEVSICDAKGSFKNASNDAKRNGPFASFFIET